jgi:hypothetical protein
LGSVELIWSSARWGMLGADAMQVTAISLGSQRPKSLGHSEDEHAQNRSSDLLYIEIDTRR